MIAHVLESYDVNAPLEVNMDIPDESSMDIDEAVNDDLDNDRISSGGGVDLR